MKKIIVILVVLLSAMLFLLEVSKVYAQSTELKRLEFVVLDEEVIFVEYIASGSKLTHLEVPEAPEKDGYIFVGWNIELPENMPDHNLRIVAQYLSSSVLIYEKIGS